MKIKFTADTKPELQGGDFKKGAILDCSLASGLHWIRRGVAVEVVDKPALKVGRPMMGVATDKPKKVGRPKKPKKDTAPAPQNLSPSLVLKGKSGIPGWND